MADPAWRDCWATFYFLWFFNQLPCFLFGILIVFISCHKGLTAREGAVGVGKATTQAVVDASLAVLISNFFMTMFLNIIYPAGYQ